MTETILRREAHRRIADELSLRVFTHSARLAQTSMSFGADDDDNPTAATRLQPHGSRPFEIVMFSHVLDVPGQGADGAETSPDT